MSLLINPNTVTAVLLADGWHTVDQDDDGISSFTIDSYEFVFMIKDPLQGTLTPIPVHGVGDSGVCAKGFQFATGGDYVSGPLTAVLAVRHHRKDRDTVGDETDLNVGT
jgi:hypothetical protein